MNKNKIVNLLMIGPLYKYVGGRSVYSAQLYNELKDRDDFNIEIAPS
ncbi:hypothetical protein KAX08_00465 [candidate division WOR-3 bacterium]|nr:hypothetical protein [candidate division WOR-3 bacterium]